MKTHGNNNSLYKRKSLKAIIISGSVSVKNDNLRILLMTRNIAKGYKNVITYLEIREPSWKHFICTVRFVKSLYRPD